MPCLRMFICTWQAHTTAHAPYRSHYSSPLRLRSRCGGRRTRRRVGKPGHADKAPLRQLAHPTPGWGGTQGGGGCTTHTHGHTCTARKGCTLHSTHDRSRSRGVGTYLCTSSSSIRVALPRIDDSRCARRSMSADPIGDDRELSSGSSLTAFSALIVDEDIGIRGIVRDALRPMRDSSRGEEHDGASATRMLTWIGGGGLRPVGM